MEFTESPKKKCIRLLRRILPLLLPFVVCGVFVLGISAASRNALSEEQNNLQKAIFKSAIASYAKDGRYPESLEEILSDYNITYDTSRFVVDYVPTGSNLLPSISVIALNSGKGGRG